MLVNSKEYWDDRFSTNWALYDGIGQSAFFYMLILQNLSKNVTKDIFEANLSICDVGCAEGEGVYLFAGYFPNSSVVGIDFSDIAISNAKSKYPGYNFICEDMTCSSESYDVLVSSNVLEHFTDPYNIVNTIVPKARKYFVMLVPFKEYSRQSEHFYTFDENDILRQIAGFKLLYFKIINCLDIPDAKWDGYQLLCVYSKTA